MTAADRRSWWKTYPVNCNFAQEPRTLETAISPSTYAMDGENQTATSAAFAVATEAQSLRFCYQTGDTRDGNSTAPLYVEVLSGSDFATVTRIDGDTVNGTLNDGWKEAVLDIQRFKGQTIQVRFRNWNY